ncbi:caspase family protein [Sphingobacterium multivorum]|uniref:caspase family protein n=1 Tax=Sphingobacterium multivorum TaxID=28454 RepID=UPI0028B0DE6D|nr:caspase family protein [Sphingobacterium multivorum]
MNKALIVGIDFYNKGSKLYGCVSDAHSLKSVLSRNFDGSINFDCRLITVSNEDESINRGELKDAISLLFADQSDIALFYFAGHGHIESTGGYILGSDASRGDDGLSLEDVLLIANNSKAINKIIILDSCHSGIAGSSPHIGEKALISEGITILTASDKNQYASEKNGSGVFTTLLIDALNGSAANILGDITPGSVYAHIDQSLGGWDQRPIFKTNVRKFISLRKAAPAISLDHLIKIKDYFPEPGFEYQLDPTFEPEMLGRSSGMPDPIKKNTEIFGILQRYNRLNLLKPIGAEHMWNAAMESKSCKLTALGEHYRKLAITERI